MPFREHAQRLSCPQPGKRLHEPCKHACQKQTCEDDCEKCHIKLKDVQLPCGLFKDEVLCYLAQDLSAIHCNSLVPQKVPGYDHTVEVACYLDVASDGFRCSTPCASILSCGHPGPGTSGKCNTKTETEKRSNYSAPGYGHGFCPTASGRPCRPGLFSSIFTFTATW